MADNDKNSAHGKVVAAMFGRIAPGYDAANRLLSCGIDSLWRRRLTRSVNASFSPGGRRFILDLAAGTLDVSLALARSIAGARVLALDFCLPMLRAGGPKLQKADAYERERVTRAAGNALALPLADASVDAVTVAFGLRNMLPRETALREACRVLVPGGGFFVLEFGSANGPLWGGLYNFYLARVLPFFGGLIAKDQAAYSYLARTITDFPSAQALGDEMRAAGFSRVSWKKMCGGIVYLHSGRK